MTVRVAVGLMFLSGHCFGQDRIDGAIRSLPADQATKDHIRLIHASIVAHQSDLRTLRANVRYTQKILGRERNDIHPTVLVGEVAWADQKTKYVLREPGVQNRVHLGVVREKDRLVVAEWQPTRNVHSFSVRPPVLTSDPWFAEREVLCTLVDPLVNGGTMSETIWTHTPFESCSSKESDDEVTIVAIASRKQTGTWVFAKKFGLMPVRWEMKEANTPQGFVNMRMTTDWAEVDGVHVPKRVELCNYMEESGSEKPSRQKIAEFSDIVVNRPEIASEVRFESLPLPDGTLGADTRSKPMLSLTFRGDGVKTVKAPVTTKEADDAFKEARETAARADESRAAAEAKRQRERRFLQNGAIVLAIVGAVAAAGYAAMTLSKRKSES